MNIKTTKPLFTVKYYIGAISINGDSESFISTYEFDDCDSPLTEDELNSILNNAYPSFENLIIEYGRDPDDYEYGYITAQKYNRIAGLIESNSEEDLLYFDETQHRYFS